jgi:hypothetical protein
MYFNYSILENSYIATFISTWFGTTQLGGHAPYNTKNYV